MFLNEEDKSRYTAPPDAEHEENSEPTPYEAGWAACEDGKSIAANPYYFSAFAECRAEWERGWNEANEEA